MGVSNDAQHFPPRRRRDRIVGKHGHSFHSIPDLGLLGDEVFVRIDGEECSALSINIHPWLLQTAFSSVLWFDLRSSFREFFAILFAHHVLGVPIGPVGIRFPDPFLVLPVGLCGANHRLGEVTRR